MSETWVCHLWMAAMGLLGVVIGVSATKRAIRIAINKADICCDDKNFIRGVLGIPQNGDRQ